MEEGQIPDAKIPDELETVLKETLGKLMVDHLQPLYKGELDIDVNYEGYTEENHIFPVNLKLADGAHINFHTMQKTADEKDNI